jgi:hypothetical protein
MATRTARSPGTHRRWWWLIHACARGGVRCAGQRRPRSGSPTAAPCARGSARPRLSWHPRRRCCTRCRRIMGPSPERSCQMDVTPRSSTPDRRSRSSSVRDGCGTRRRTWLRSRRLPMASRGPWRSRARRRMPLASRFMTVRSSISGGSRRRICAAGWPAPPSTRCRHATSPSVFQSSRRDSPDVRWCSATSRACASTGTAPRRSSHQTIARRCAVPSTVGTGPARTAPRPGVHGRPDGGCLPAPV